MTLQKSTVFQTEAVLAQLPPPICIGNLGDARMPCNDDWMFGNVTLRRCWIARHARPTYLADFGMNASTASNMNGKSFRPFSLSFFFSFCATSPWSSGGNCGLVFLST